MGEALKKGSFLMQSSRLLGDDYFVPRYSHYDPPEGNFEACLYSLTEGTVRWNRRFKMASAPSISLAPSNRELILTDTYVDNSVFKIAITTLAVSSGETIAETHLEVPGISFESNVNAYGPLLVCTLNTLQRERIGFLIDLQSGTVVKAFPTGERFLVSACRNSESSFSLVVKQHTLIELLDSTDCSTVRDQIHDRNLRGYPIGSSPVAFVTPEQLYYVSPDSLRIERFEHGLNLPSPVLCWTDLSRSGRYVSVIASGVGTQLLGIIDLVEKKPVFSRDISRRCLQTVDPDSNRICYLRSVFCKLAVEVRDIDDNRLSTLVL